MSFIKPRKDIEKISTYRSSMQFDITRTLQIIDSLNELGNELEILFSILGKYSTYLPISDNSWNKLYFGNTLEIM